MTLAEVEQRVTSAAIQQQAAEYAAQRAHADADAAAARVRACDVGLAVLHAVRDVTSARVQQTIAELCSEGLRIVFNDPDVRLEVRPVERRGVVEMDLVLVRGELETDPLTGNGGGLVADAAAMLRLIMVRLLSQRGLQPLLVLDEPFAALSHAHRAAMADTLHDVAESMGIQVLTVTHADEFARGTVYEVVAGDGEALVTLKEDA